MLSADEPPFPIFDGYTIFVSTGPFLDDIIRVFEDGEVSTTVTFDDGTELSGVLGLLDRATLNFGISSDLYLLDEAALESVGKTLDDVASVTVDTFVDHDLTWADLGFGDGDTPIDPDPPTPILIEGTQGSDNLTGTAEDEVFVSFGGRADILTGGDGADTFVFGPEAGNGQREIDVILDYTAGDDVILLAEGAQVQRVIETGGGDVVIRLEGADRDIVRLLDVEGGADAVALLFSDDSFVLI